MTVTVFASSSSGNCTLVSEGGTHLLIDAGISLRRIRSSLAARGLTVEKLTAVLITHEHTDHVSALPMLCKYHLPVLYAPRPAANHLCRCQTGVDEFMHIFPVGESVQLGELNVTAFPTPHDADGSVGYRIEGSGVFGFCTDCGHITEDIREGLRGCSAAVIEANHDEELLRYGPYTVALKRRILSDSGHLSNRASGELAAFLAENGARSLILGHLSQENNRPSLAEDTVRAALDTAGHPQVSVVVAPVFGAVSLEVPPCST